MRKLWDKIEYLYHYTSVVVWQWYDSIEQWYYKNKK